MCGYFDREHVIDISLHHWSAHAAAHLWCFAACFWTFDCLVHGENETRCLAGRLQGVQLND